MATPYGRRAKAGPRKTLSSRLGFRYGRSDSAASATAVATKPFGSASNLLEPRTAAAASSESDTSASTLESSPAPLGENQPPRGTRSFTVAVVGDAHSRCRLGTGGHEAPVTGTGGGGEIRVAFEKDEFSSTSGKALGLTVSPAKEGGDGEALGARVDELPKTTTAAAGEEGAWSVRRAVARNRATGIAYMYIHLLWWKIDFECGVLIWSELDIAVKIFLCQNPFMLSLLPTKLAAATELIAFM